MNQVFKNHPNLKKYYQTADGTKFFQEDHAKNHARSLEDRTVATVIRGVSGKTEAPVEKQASKAKPSKAAKAENSGTVDSKDLTLMQAAKLRVEAIEKLETVKEIIKALEGETAKSVKTAGTERIAAINASKALDSNKENNNVQTQ
ncbi:MAG: hypothetical protein JJE55_08245 [Flavobacteriaceae bacterium]|nr:hypothetical protein [Flavobacteriaceae bacterium]